MHGIDTGHLVRFDRYMESCLYGPDGFYSSGRGSAGRRRDFITSPEVGPLFGAVIARWLDERWDALGQPRHFRVIDVGSGPGALTKSLEVAQPRCAKAWELVNVDVAPGASSLPEDLSDSIVIANELLDNMPFRVWRMGDEAWEEVFIDADGAAAPEAVWADIDDISYSLRYQNPDDLEDTCRLHSFPVLDRASSFVDDVLGRNVAGFLIFDYGASRTVDLDYLSAQDPFWPGWLRTYRTHQRGFDPLLDPGEWDITTDIAVDQFQTPDVLQTQARFLQAHGIKDLVEEGRSYWEAHASAPDLEAVRMRSRITEAKALLDLKSLGSWQVFEYRRGR